MMDEMQHRRIADEFSEVVVHLKGGPSLLGLVGLWRDGDLSDGELADLLNVWNQAVRRRDPVAWIKYERAKAVYFERRDWHSE
uniref:hypothetical protein n=1 Tax=Arvimicrobium flavum TaxID=3393320 RepID=UPI00237AA042